MRTFALAGWYQSFQSFRYRHVNVSSCAHHLFRQKKPSYLFYPSCSRLFKGCFLESFTNLFLSCFRELSNYSTFIWPVFKFSQVIFKSYHLDYLFWASFFAFLSMFLSSGYSLQLYLPVVLFIAFPII